MRHITNVIIVLAAASLAACTTADHFESQNRLERGLRQLAVAEVQVFRETSLTAQERQILATPQIQSPETVRANLAADAKRDIETVTGSFADATALDRISALYRAGIKAWKAADAAGALVIEIANRGRASCRALRDQPDRDCGMFELITPLAEAQSEIVRLDAIDLRNRRFPANAQGKGIGTNDIAPVADAVAKLQKSFNTLTSALDGNVHPRLGISAPVPTLLHGFIDVQRVLIWCHALRGKTLLGIISLTPPPEVATAIQEMMATLQREVDQEASDAGLTYCRGFSSRVMAAEARHLDIDTRNSGHFP